MSAAVGSDRVNEGRARDFPVKVPPSDWNDGVEALVRLLRRPHDVAYWLNSDLPAELSSPVDWDRLPMQLRDFFESTGTTAVEAYLRVRLALGVLCAKQVRICSGPADIHFWTDSECCEHLTVTLTVDVNSYEAYRLGGELRNQVVHCVADCAGVLIRIRSAHPFDRSHWPERPAQEDFDLLDEE